MTNFNIISPEFQEDPYALFAQLRQTAAAVPVAPLGFYAVGRYDDVLYVLKNPQLFSSSAIQKAFTMMSGSMMQGEITDLLQHNMLGMDPPDHTRLRRLINRAFTTKAIEGMAPRIRAITNECIDTILQKGEFDMINDLASPLPIIVIAEMLGVEPERRQDFRQWSNDMVSLGASMEMPPPEEASRQNQSRVELFAYLEEIIAERRREPQDDLISAMIRAEEEADTLTAEEVMSMTVLLLIAGNETTTNLIGNATIVLRDYPEVREQLKANPTLIPDFIEETLRYNGPVLGLFREATQEVELSGVTIPQGAFVMPFYASANHDETVFPNPERFDLLRENKKHVAFGFGIHFCLGAPLARLEACIAFEEIFKRIPNAVVTDDKVNWINSFILRGVRTLPMKTSAAHTVG